MTKRKRDSNGANEAVGDKVSDEETTSHNLLLDEKRPKVPENVDELEESRETGSLATNDNMQAESSRSRGRGRTSRINENSSDSEDRHELRWQKSLDGEDSASDKGSVMEETNSHLYQELLDAILKMKDTEGRMICGLFLKLPPRQQYPEYYKVIKEPIDLKMIYSRFKNNAYASLDDIERDLQLVVKNAHAFNEPGSQVYKDATAIKKTVAVKRQEIEHTLSGAKSSKRLRSKRATTKMSLAINALLSDTDDDEEMQTDTSQLMDEEEFEKNNAELLEDDTDDPFLALYNSVRMYADYSGRIVCDAFMRLPSKRTYPDYYEVIKNPIGLSRIGSNTKNGLYESLDALAAEMNSCFENAKSYNETESMLYQDAITLQEVIQTRKTEIEKFSLERGIDLRRTVKGTPRPSDSMQGEDADLDSKDTSSATKPMLIKKISKKAVALSENEANILKKRTREMYDAVQSYQDEHGRCLSLLFLELPSAAQYPDYYEIISEPTCLRMIDRNIHDGRYSSEHQFLLDFEIMFENAKHYNEVGSQVHQDALTLDKILKKKRKSLGRPQLGQLDTSSSTSPSVKQTTPGNKQTTPTKSTRSISSVRGSQPAGTTDVKELCKELFNSVKDYTDITGRYLCGIFQKLPSKNDYPDYYSLIKRPIDMSKISTKVHAEQYSTSEECFQDFVLMFDNACKYNDPDSQVYKDSLVLLKELLATKLELLGDCDMHVPDVPEVVQKMIEEMYDAVIRHQDDEGRCTSDSLMHLPNYQEVDESGQKKNVLSLLTIGKLVKKKYYKRLDKFQEDLFAFFEKARTSPFDSEVYDDAVDLQQFFVQERDRVCKEGEWFVSPAISLTKRHLAHELDEERKRKVKEEASELDGETNKETDKWTGEEGEVMRLSEIKVGNDDITVGDYVYIDVAGDRFIVAVENIWMDKEYIKWIRGPWFYRPDQTSHDVARKFIEKEVLRSDKNTPVNINQIKGLCYVMYVKNYVKSKPLDFDEDDVFVCGSSYNSSQKLFKKIKGWSSSHSVKHMARDQPFLLNRAALHDGKVIREVVKDDDEELIASLFQKIEEKKNLQIDAPNPDGFVTYEQYWVDSGCYKLGDTVYSQTDEGYWAISRIDKIWSDRQGVAYFSGTTFIKPDDTQHLPTHMFYDKEVFHIPTEEAHRMNDIVRKCFVLPIREFMRCRPTDVPEEHVYLCESRYDEDEGGHFRKLKGLKRPTLSTNVYEEEFYFFEENLNLLKKPSPLLVTDISLLKRDDRMPSPALAGADTESGKAAKKRSRAQSGFLLFSTEKRNIIRKQHPDYTFGDISKMIGTEWKNLNPTKREEWESRGSFQTSAKAISVTSPPTSYSNGPGIAYDCVWQGCDYQYEDLNELIIHVLESGGHLMKLENGICPCLWRNCERLKRGFRPFTSLTKLIRHCRELHLKGPPRRVELHERSKNHFPKNQAPPQPEPLSPNSVPVTLPMQQPGNPAFVGVVPSPTPSHVLASTQSVNINLMDPQYSNVMRLPTPELAQTMMGMSSSYGNAALPTTLVAQNSANIQRQGNVVNNSAATVTSINQFAHIQAMGGAVSQQQFTTSIPQFSYQQHPPQDQQQANQLSLPYVQGLQQSLQQQTTHLAPPRQTTPLQEDQRQSTQQGVLPLQRAQFMDSQSAETQMTPLFHSPPPRQQKLLHSDAYLRYIEGLRDGTQHLSNWNPNKPDINKMTPQQQAQLPVHWLGSAYNPHPSTVDALWALREHMLNDALKLSKFTQSFS